jgi:predicted nucleotidyltransferase
MNESGVLETKMKGHHGAPDKALLKEVVHRVVEAVHPDKIILFGSAARGEMSPHSDLDLLVIKQVRNRRRTVWAIDRGLRGIMIGVDLVVATPRDIERYGDSPALVYYPALREGKVIYDGEALPT